MKPWDGVFQQYRYKAPERLLVDAGGSVYYFDPGRASGALVRF